MLTIYAMELQIGSLEAANRRLSKIARDRELEIEELKVENRRVRDMAARYQDRAERLERDISAINGFGI